MDGRIRELAEQALKTNITHDAVYRPYGYNNCVSKNFADTFAELIIKECAYIAARNQAENMSWDISEIIKEHFGFGNRA